MKTQMFDALSLIDLEEQQQQDLYVSSLDPLQADEALKLVPEYNRQQKTIELVLLFVDLLPSVAEVSRFDFSQAAAAMRDIGIMLGSLKRHGIEPVNVIPELEEKLNILGNITYLPPRDTLIHYVRWNPQGDRLRTYTGTEDERQLINSVHIAIHPLHKAILFLNELYHLPLHSPEFVSVCNLVIDNFQKMIEGIVNAKRKVSPAYFANELRFYYDPIILNDKEYLGPGAVEMPVFVFDHILWNCDLNDTTLTHFKESYLPYNQFVISDLYHKYQNIPSLTTKVIHSLQENNNFLSAKIQGVQTLLKLFNLIKSFRAPHKKLADEAYAHAEQGEFREKGSGGYEPSILHYILNQNLIVLEKLKQAMQAYV